MNRTLLILVGLILILSCREKKSTTEDKRIIIFDIAESNRTQLGRQLKMISKCSPKIIGIDVFLTNDSLNIDTILVNELSKLKNTVKCIALYNNLEDLNSWDSLEVSNIKFKTTFEGFTNITITDDSVVVPELPMRQYYKDKQVTAFSYLIAENSFGVKEEFKYGDSDFTFDIDDFGNHFKIITPTDLASGNFKTADFKDKIVVMGYVGNYKDTFYLDKKRKKKISGAEVQACFIRNILN